ncbi:peptidylprolyl isomerase [Pseudohoeflea coraliihabitans]|uniref:peptidylprolyl isomerase n=1 Tax=Pseudohoeflea coraliihabitans TaxID=2860393 RepID=A0ABS6WKK9_9HYPH|nr:peptidylprolyl isomerase [Pseudohoeflea sp. DP4N28-3]MBW3096481.1 peptidylprolyl isomerase [Pseudohoeflea sp. DP4N28-3]
MRHTPLLAAVFFAATLSLSTPLHAAEDDPVVAKVGGVELHQSELRLAEGELDPQFAQMPAEQRRLAALAAAIDVKLLARLAEDEDLEETETYKRQMAYYRDRTLHNLMFKEKIVDTITDEDARARYDKEIAAMPSEEEVKARHVLVKTEDEAKAVIAELEDGKDFIELAKTKSTGPSAAEGGDLGYFTKGRMVPAFEEAAFALEPGEFTKEPVQSEFGFHVIKVEDRRAAAPPSFEQVEGQVRQVLLRERYADLMASARDSIDIEVVDPDLKAKYEQVMAMQKGGAAAAGETENGDGAAEADGASDTQTDGAPDAE